MDHEAVRVRKDGSKVHLSIRGAAISRFDSSGEYLAIYRDITERIRSEQELANERIYFENLFMNSPLAIALVCDDGVIQGSTSPLKNCSDTAAGSASG